MRWASVALPGVALCALPCTCSMTGFRSMNTCVAAHAINGFGSDIMLILPNNDAYCDLCDLISATCKIRCSCIESHAVKTCCILTVRSCIRSALYWPAVRAGIRSAVYWSAVWAGIREVLYTGLLFVHVRNAVFVHVSEVLYT